MNKVQLLGRLTRDVTINNAGENTVVGRFGVAVNRRFKNKEGNYDADFINCVAFGKTADFIAKYLAKGSMIGIVGRIQTGSYEKDGVTVYTTDVVVEEAHFAGSAQANNSGAAYVSGNTDFMNIPDGAEEELPFN